VSRPFQPDPALGLEEVDVEKGYALYRDVIGHALGIGFRWGRAGKREPS